MLIIIPQGYGVYFNWTLGRVLCIFSFNSYNAQWGHCCYYSPFGREKLVDSQPPHTPANLTLKFAVKLAQK